MAAKKNLYEVGRNGTPEEVLEANPQFEMSGGYHWADKNLVMGTIDAMKAGKNDNFMALVKANWCDGSFVGAAAIEGVTAGQIKAAIAGEPMQADMLQVAFVFVVQENADKTDGQKIQALQTLLDAGAKADSLNSLALSIAVTNRAEKVADFLYSKGADVEAALEEAKASKISDKAPLFALTAYRLKLEIIDMKLQFIAETGRKPAPYDPKVRRIENNGFPGSHNM